MPISDSVYAPIFDYFVKAQDASDETPEEAGEDPNEVVSDEAGAIDPEVVAEILYGLYGDRAMEMIRAIIDENAQQEEPSGQKTLWSYYRKAWDGDGQKSLLDYIEKAWNSADHPRGPHGRFIAKGSPEAITAARQVIGDVISGRSTASPKDVLDHLSILTVKQIRELGQQHGKKVPKMLREELVDAVRQLIEGKPAEQPTEAESAAPPESTPEEQPSPEAAVPKPVTSSPGEAERAPGAEEGAEPASGEANKPDPAPNALEQNLEKYQIADIGERSGTARKDRAVKTGPRQNVMEKPEDQRPGWARRYHVAQDVKTGKYFLADSRKKSNRLLSRRLYDSKEEAMRAVPLLEVSRNHRVRNKFKPDGTLDLSAFAIYRKISDYKSAIVKDGFKSSEEAMKYMAEHPEEIIEHEFNFPKEVPHLSHIRRTGKEVRTGNVDPKKFHKEFGFRGVEFGNWNMGNEGQQAINHAYDALHDLSDVLRIPPEAVSLNGRLILGFGSHGRGGKNAARAHYEPGAGVINLTKIEGAGTLAHEWFHALDHHIGKLAGFKDDSGQPAFGSTTIAKKRGVASEARQELMDAFQGVINSIRYKETQVKVGREKYEKAHEKTVEYLADELSRLDRSMNDYTQYKKRAGLSGEDKQKWDSLKSRLMAGDVGEKVHILGQGPWSLGRESTTVIEEMNSLYKKATGRSFVSADYKNDRGRSILNYVKNVKESKARLDGIGESKTETMRTDTDYASQAKEIDKHRSGDYWSTIEELGARAFESYINDKVADRGDRSDYLVYGTKNDPDDTELGKPYPEGDERKTINAAFERLFQAMKHSDFIGQSPQATKSYRLDPVWMDFHREIDSLVEKAYSL